MAIKQSPFFKGMGRLETPTPRQAGVSVDLIVSHTFSENLYIADTLDWSG